MGACLEIHLEECLPPQNHSNFVLKFIRWCRHFKGLHFLQDLMDNFITISLFSGSIPLVNISVFFFSHKKKHYFIRLCLQKFGENT